MVSSIPLEGLYLHLVRSGFPLSVRDYQDALTALRYGYGLHRREDLRWLCESLWVRSDQELSRVERMFRDFPRPSSEQIRKLTGKRARKDSSRERAGKSTGSEVAEQAPAIEFAPPTQGGVGIPRAQLPRDAFNLYILTPRPVVSLRSVIIAWRRFRLAQRSGPRVEADIGATIAEQCRQGILVEPVLVPARRNQARVVVLVDSSPSMIVWRHINQLLADSLERSKLAHATIFFFDNIPIEDVYEVDTLQRRVSLAHALMRSAQSALLIVSDAGAVRGRLDRGRLTQTRRFVEGIKTTWQPIAWVNPMPRVRWTGSTAEHIARLPGLAMFELNDEGWIHAIDYLRGKRSA